MAMAVSFLTAQSPTKTQVFITTTAGQTSHEIDEVRSMELKDNTLIVNKRSTTKQDLYKLADVSKISFQLGTGIAETLLADSGLSIYAPAGSDKIYVRGYDPAKQYEVVVYDNKGATLLSNMAWQGESIDVASLPQGLYIVRINNAAFKFTK